jgi:hypothetical protein
LRIAWHWLAICNQISLAHLHNAPSPVSYKQ